MEIQFTKMEGCGNDYIYIDGAKCALDQKDKPDFVRKVSDRHFGIGSDGVIFINPSSIADFEMEMYNADGSRSEMCGNGIRCVAKFVYDKGLTDREEMTIESFGKIKGITVYPKDGKAETVRVDMEEPILKPEEIPVLHEDKSSSGNPSSQDDAMVDEPILVNRCEYRMTCVSMGNPHAVIFTDPDTLQIETLGPLFENHERFPKRTNTEFVKIIDRNNVKMRVWERGTGETLACGTGCCATAVACILNGLTDEKVSVHVPGGIVDVEWNRKTNRVFMTGPATTVFEGTIQW